MRVEPAQRAAAIDRQSGFAPSTADDRSLGDHEADRRQLIARKLARELEDRHSGDVPPQRFLVKAELVVPRVDDQAQQHAQPDDHQAGVVFQPAPGACDILIDRSRENGSGAVLLLACSCPRFPRNGPRPTWRSRRSASRLRVDFAHRLERGHRVALGAHLHADLAAIADVVDRPQHECVVDLPVVGWWRPGWSASW